MPDSISFQLPIGTCFMTATPEGVESLVLTDRVRPLSAAPEYIKVWAQGVKDYTLGYDKLENIPVNIKGGSELQRSVWQAIAQVPYGETISYTELAERVGAPHAVRAVASACGKNPVGLIVPCHRIVAKDGGLGGYAWGLETKRFLLDMESRHVNSFDQAALAA